MIAYSAAEAQGVVEEVDDHLSTAYRFREMAREAQHVEAARLDRAGARDAANRAGMRVVDLAWGGESEATKQARALAIEADDCAREVEDVLEVLEVQDRARRYGRKVTTETMTTTSNAARPAPAHPATRKLAVSSGRKPGPVRVCLYTAHGLGKTTFAAESGALLIDIAGGSDHVDCTRIEQRSLGTFNALLDALDAVAKDPEFAEHKTVAIDEITGLEALIHRFIVGRDKPSSRDRDGGYTLTGNIEAYGYKKGYEVALLELEKVLGALEVLHRQGRNVLLLGHVGLEKAKRPDGDDYERYAPKADPKFAARISQWCDVVAFGQFETVTTKSGKFGKAKVDMQRSRGRILHVQPSPAWDAKTRYPMPAQMNFDASTFWAALRKGQVDEPKILRKEIDTTLAAIEQGLERLDNEVAVADGRKLLASAREFLGTAGDDTARLGRTRDKLRVRLADLERALEAQGDTEPATEPDDGAPPDEAVA